MDGPNMGSITTCVSVVDVGAAVFSFYYDHLLIISAMKPYRAMQVKCLHTHPDFLNI